MSRGLITLFVVLVTAAALPADAQVITNVTRRNPNATSSSVQVRIAPQPLATGVRPYADRVHVLAGVPKELIGAQYVQMSNEDKFNPSHELHITVGSPGTLYLYIDTRIGTGLRVPTATVDLVAGGMTWVTELGFVDTGLKMGIDEGANGAIEGYYSVFSLQVTPGVIVLKGQYDRSTGNPYDRNMYGVAAKLVRNATNPMPADGQAVTAPPLLQWTPGVGVAFHNVYVGTSPQLSEADLVGSRLATPAFQYGLPLIPGAIYYWRVDEIEANATTVNTGNVWTFKAVSVTAFDPIPVSGTPWVDPNTALRWKAGLNAIGHDLYFDVNEAAVAGGAASAFRGTLSLTAWQPPTLAPDLIYFWRIDEVAQDGTKQAGPVWFFSTVRNIAVSDPNLLGWWKMDEGLGVLVADWSGRGRHAQFAEPAPTWAPGLSDGALRLTGAGESAVHEDGSFLNGLGALTVMAWVKSNVTDTDKGFIIFQTPIGEDDADIRYDAAGVTGGGLNVIKAGVTVSEGGLSTVRQVESSNGRQTTDWQHLAITWSSGQALRLYVDGQLDSPTFNSGVGTGVTANFSTVIIGKGAKDTLNSSWDGLIDDVRIYDEALTETEIQAAMRGDPRRAWGPHPANGATVNIFTVLPLTWQAGDKAVAHDVYLGTDPATVGATTIADTTGVYRGRQSETSYLPAPPLELTVRYFWRIDEVADDGSITPGLVWDFMLDD